jgi:hypothetical protein
MQNKYGVWKFLQCFLIWSNLTLQLGSPSFLEGV